MNGAAKLERYSAPALSKGLDILEFLSNEPRAQKKSDIARGLNRSISEIFRMLVVLEQREYVSFDASSDRYALTTKLFELAHRYPPIRRLSSVAGETMQELARTVNQTVHLAILRDTHVLVIVQADSPGDNVTTVRLGARIPLIQTASGPVLTADLQGSERQLLNEKLKGEKPRLRKLYRENCQMVRRKGYCECPSMVLEGVLNMSVPVRDHAGDVIAAMTIPFVKRLATTHYVSRTRTRSALIVAGQNVSRMFGGEFSK